MRSCMISVDVEEDIDSVTTFRGVENLCEILTIFDKFDIEATIFTTGEALARYPNLIKKWSERHEIACHGYYHVPLHELSIPERERQLRDFCRLYHAILEEEPKGFRAVMHTIDNAQLKSLEQFGFIYDSSVVPRYVPFRKYAGYKGKAPTQPYHPSYDNYRRRGNMRILEIPNTPLIFGISLYGTWLRLLGPKFYRVLLALKAPSFVSLAVHSWDCVELKGRFSANSGNGFPPILERVLSLLRSRGYRFISGKELMNSLGKPGL